jgi:DNA-binding PadR family transcriptional regulator
MGDVALGKTSTRAMTSVVYWALLGLVIERPSYGLELYNRYQRLYADLLPVSGSSHIYTALDALEDRAFIETMSATGSGRQPKPYYQVTALGMSGFLEWYVEQMDAQRRGLELWARQLAVFAQEPARAIDLIARFRREYLQTVGEIGNAPKPANSRGALIDELVAEQQRIAAGGTLSWLRFANARFQALARSVAENDSP